MNAPLYTTEILRLAASLHAPRALNRVDGEAEQRSPTCGSRIRTQVQVRENGQIEGLSQEVQACAFGQAAATLTENAIGRSREEVAEALAALTAWLDGEEQEPTWFPIAPLAPARSKRGRHGAILLPLRTLLAAMEQQK